MTALLKTTQIQEPSSATVNITLDSSGGTSVNSIQGTIINGTVNSGGTSPFPSSGGPTSVLFTGIPSWAKRVTVMFTQFSTSGTSAPQIQIGSGSLTTSGYLGYGQNLTVTPASSATAASTGWILQAGSASNSIFGMFTIALFTTNTWVISGVVNNASTTSSFLNGSVVIGGALDRVNITTVNGTDTFDAGSINISYQG